MIRDSDRRFIVTRRSFLAMGAAALAGLNTSCDSSPSTAVEPRIATHFTDASFARLTPEQARERLAIFKSQRPDCVIEPITQAVDAEMRSIMAGKRTYSPLELPASNRSKSIEVTRDGIDSRLKQEVEKMSRNPSPIERAKNLAVLYREYADAQVLASQRLTGLDAIDLRDIAECHRVKAHSLVIYLILNGSNQGPSII